MEGQFLSLSQESKRATEVFRHVDPLNFYKEFLKEGLRPDGRKLCSYRKTYVRDLDSTSTSASSPSPTRGVTHTSQTGDLDMASEPAGPKVTPKRTLKNVLLSSVLLNRGNSQYQCKLTGDLGYSDALVVTPDQLDELFSVDVVVPKHVVNEIYDINGPCINISHLVSELVQNTLNSPDLVPKEQFWFDMLAAQVGNASGDKILKHVKAAKLRWRLNLEIVCDEYDGNLLDMCFQCCYHCLVRARVPYALVGSKFDQFYPDLLTSFSPNDLATPVSLH